MHIRHHGGHCCAIKTIEGFGYGPDFPMCERKGTEPKKNDYGGYHFRPKQWVDADGGNFRTDFNVFYEPAPAESAEERLARLIDFLARKRPSGIVEICLADEYGDECGQVEEWEDIILDHGFKRVTEAWNSNSGNMVYVYHLVMGYTQGERWNGAYQNEDFPYNTKKD